MSADKRKVPPTRLASKRQTTLRQTKMTQNTKGKKPVASTSTGVRKARTKAGKTKHDVSLLFRGPQPGMQVYVELPAWNTIHMRRLQCSETSLSDQTSESSNSYSPASGASRLPPISTTPQRTLPKLKLRFNPKASEWTIPASTPSTIHATNPTSPNAVTRRVMLHVTPPTSPTSRSFQNLNSLQTLSEAASSSSSSASESSSNDAYDVDADTEDSLNDLDDPQSFDTLRIPLRSPTTARKSFYVGDACDPCSRGRVKRKRSAEQLNASIPNVTATPPRKRKVILHVRSPSPVATSANAPSPFISGKGKGKSLIFEPTRDTSTLPDNDSMKDHMQSGETEVADSADVGADLCAMCASWRACLAGSLGKAQEWLAPAEAEECDDCREKALSQNDVSSSDMAGDAEMGEEVILGPSFSRLDLTDNEETSMTREETYSTPTLDASSLPSATQETFDSGSFSPPSSTPSLSSRSDSSTSTLSSPGTHGIDISDLELLYPTDEEYRDSPPPSPTEEILEMQAGLKATWDWMLWEWARQDALAEAAAPAVTACVDASANKPSAPEDGNYVNMEDWLSPTATTASTMQSQ